VLIDLCVSTDLYALSEITDRAVVHYLIGVCYFYE